MEIEKITTTQAVDVSFTLLGQNIPFEHGYALYGAISSLLPALHEADWLGIHPIYGERIENEIRLASHSRLRFRVHPDKIGAVLPVAGKSLQIGARRVLTGTPQVRMLRPVNALRSYRVTFKHAMTDAEMLQHLLDELKKLNIQGDISAKRAMPLQIKDKKIICYRVLIQGLSEEHSLELQTVGLGGRRRMGCGLFDPVLENQ